MDLVIAGELLRGRRAEEEGGTEEEQAPEGDAARGHEDLLPKTSGTKICQQVTFITNFRGDSILKNFTFSTNFREIPKKFHQDLREKRRISPEIATKTAMFAIFFENVNIFFAEKLRSERCKSM